jgi:hypothetical protein
MFRDTFAVELLLAGVPIDQVSLLLGHSSVKVTEKHYAPFVKARQAQLAQSARTDGLGTDRTETPCHACEEKEACCSECCVTLQVQLPFSSRMGYN